MTQTPQTRATRYSFWSLPVVGAAILAGCASPIPPAPPPAVPAPPPQAVTVAPPPPPVDETPRGAPSQARTPREYRTDAAGHLYARNRDRIYTGKMPPLLYAVGVLQVHVDTRGHVSGLSWMRAPNHAPEVMAEIERTVRQAAPYPVSPALGRVTYTDTWLWDRSGRFQLDTLTEGQLGEMPSRASRLANPPVASPVAAARATPQPNRRPAAKPPATSCKGNQRATC